MNRSSLNAIAATLIMVLLFLVAIKAFNIYYPIKITNSNMASELSVVGEGKVDVVPDTTEVELGISITNLPTVDEVQKSIDKTNNSIVAAMGKLGISKENIKTSNYSIYPNQVYEGNNAPRTTGYNGSVTVTVKAKGTDLASKVIEEGTKAGANQVYATRFTVEEPDKYRELARSEAIKNAKEQAQKLAKDLDIKLGKVVNIVEYSPNAGGPMPMYDMTKSAIGGGGGPDLQAGSQTITSVVTLYFEKK